MEADSLRASPDLEALLVDTTSLFLHVLAAVGMVGGGIVQVLAGTRLRAESSPGGIASWAGFARSAGFLILGSAVVSLLSGGHLAGAVWTTEAKSGFAFPFITLGATGLVVLGPIGPMIGGARLRRLVAAAQAQDGGLATPELLGLARSPSLWGPVHSLVGVGVGFVALMTYKPGWVVGSLVLLVTFALGWLAGVWVARN